MPIRPDILLIRLKGDGSKRGMQPHSERRGNTKFYIILLGSSTLMAVEELDAASFHEPSRQNQIIDERPSRAGKGRVQGVGCRVQGVECMVYGVGCRV